MLVGYARTSTLEQEAGLDAQLRDLTGVGCKKLFQEQVSSVGARKELDAALDFCREGDTLVVTKLDRLARSVTHLGRLLEHLTEKGVALRILSMGVDTGTPTGKLMLNVMASVAQFEREMMLERQREGIAKAKGEGRYKGRKPTAQARSEEVLALRAQGLSMDAIAARLGIGKGSVVRVIKGAGQNEAQALRQAERTAERKGGAVALRMTVDGEIGEVERTQIVARYGEIPENLDELMS